MLSTEYLARVIDLALDNRAAGKISAPELAELILVVGSYNAIANQVRDSVAYLSNIEKALAGVMPLGEQPSSAAGDEEKKEEHPSGPPPGTVLN